MVRIIVGSDNELDISAPIYIHPEKRKKIIEFLRKLIGNIETKAVEEPTISYERGESVWKYWTKEDLLEILKTGSNNDELGKRLGRSTMSIGMMRGHFLPEYLAWLRKNNLLKERDDPQVQKIFIEKVHSE